MPVAAEIGGLLRDNDEVTGARFDLLFTTRAQIGLTRLVWLHRLNELGTERHPKKAHPTTTAVMMTNSTTTTTSNVVRSWSRNGLSPMRGKVVSCEL